jgi:hypothetical protein
MGDINNDFNRCCSRSSVVPKAILPVKKRMATMSAQQNNFQLLIDKCLGVRSVVHAVS